MTTIIHLKAMINHCEIEKKIKKKKRNMTDLPKYLYLLTFCHHYFIALLASVF